ncbi:MAG: hypothetical protein WC939_01505 [Acholeplasmataceae bacterium]
MNDELTKQISFISFLISIPTILFSGYILTKFILKKGCKGEVTIRNVDDTTNVNQEFESSINNIKLKQQEELNGVEDEKIIEQLENKHDEENKYPNERIKNEIKMTSGGNKPITEERLGELRNKLLQESFHPQINTRPYYDIILSLDVYYDTPTELTKSPLSKYEEQYYDNVGKYFQESNIDYELMAKRIEKFIDEFDKSGIHWFVNLLMYDIIKSWECSLPTEKLDDERSLDTPKMEFIINRF